MINCRDAEHLFDRYLDGELSPSLTTELHAHRLHCADCQTELSILEACGDVIGLDAREPTLNGSFTDRVMMAYRVENSRRQRRWRRVAMWAGLPASLAASVLLAFLWATSPLQNPGSSPPGSVVLPIIEAVPKGVQDTMLGATGTPLTAQARRELDNTPQMDSANFMEALLEPSAVYLKETVESARLGLQDFRGLLMNRNGPSDPADTSVGE
jgi:hypothetical protein